MDQKGSIHLHGHNHGRFNYKELNQKYRRMDIGCDTNNFKPYSINEIIEIMHNRKIKVHNS
jgi:calcineurin-like phosphoesterase family protein